MTLSFSGDAYLNIVGGKVPLGNEIIDFSKYIICLQF